MTPIPVTVTDWEARALWAGRLQILRRPLIQGTTSPFGEVETRLRIQERFLIPEWEDQQDLVEYAADYTNPGSALADLNFYRETPVRGWQKARVMPPWASRLFLRVTALEMAVLQTSVETAALEGVVEEDGLFGLLGQPIHASAEDALIARWEAEWGHGTWWQNGWTWAARVEVVSRRGETRKKARRAEAHA